ncbi:MAG TPA: DUF3105 domain-containing protein [Labilithrix sp.]|nr:DUF3105 domain-containing protein [Labilithrix sp.]
MRRTRAFATCACAAALGLAGLGACASDDERAAPTAADASPDRVAASPRTVESGHDAAPEAAPVDAAPVDGGPCNVRVDAVPVVDSPHVPDGTPVVYGSNPPSSGPHYGTWANFQELTHPVDDGYLVHSLEHGAVLLLYKCQGAACDALVPALRAVRNASLTDPICDPAIRNRVILAPRAGNDVAVAAAAWGFVYRADCLDAASLASFIAEHYAKAPENLCVAGQVF